MGSLHVRDAGPLDGQIIDGTLLTSESEATDEQPLVPENPFEEEEGISTYRTYLSSGTAHISNQGNGTIYMMGETFCNKICDSVQVNIYLDKLENGNWWTIKTQHYTAYDDHYASNGLLVSVEKGYYYRVRGVHVAKKGSVTESTSTCTSGIYIY